MGHEVGVTSLQFAQMGSIIANGGYLVAPYLVAWEQEPTVRASRFVILTGPGAPA